MLLQSERCTVREEVVFFEEMANFPMNADLSWTCLHLFTLLAQIYPSTWVLFSRINDENKLHHR